MVGERPKRVSATGQRKHRVASGADARSGRWKGAWLYYPAVPYRRSEVQHSHGSVSRQPSAQRNVYAFSVSFYSVELLLFSSDVHYRVLDCLSVVL
ncbi:unnamed protein product [Acanthoscelides obtectus]|uniref:Uncharacterized protein n=1 Tax=Acanthoscelides obtectus TaxID=200917 RepID=A0A9P0LQW2_ACAOB|nr:unnamed protein product [Acanthoscelides obtectus]CAK1677935.1 hypothetical protein AOBTE_LOCUS31656 [Acanthoscelides obtectus]